MDWIEQLFHISPDGGNGATEALIFIALILIVAAYPLGSYAFKRRRQRAD